MQLYLKFYSCVMSVLCPAAVCSCLNQQTDPDYTATENVPIPRTYPSNRKFNEKSFNLKIKFTKPSINRVRPRDFLLSRGLTESLTESIEDFGRYVLISIFHRACMHTLLETTEPSCIRSTLMKIPSVGFETCRPCMS